jgi:hypothetical protein
MAMILAHLMAEISMIRNCTICTYEIQNDLLRLLDVFSFPLTTDPLKMYSWIENCRFKLVAEQ